ncbi:MAG: acyl carrier protein [Chlorobi bacterium]|nr:acyl carrier protein [Chlorobiota bacterium]
MENRIKEIMAAVFETEISNITDDASPDTIENWDSLRLINLVAALEDEFNIEFEEEEIVEMLNFKLVALLVAEKIK